MRIPSVQKSFFFLDLRLGSTLVSLLFAIWNLIGMICFAISAGGGGSVRGTYIFLSVMSAFLMLTCVLLFFGVRWERAGFIQIWLVTYTVLGLAYGIAAFVGAILAFVALKVGAGIGILFMSILWFLFQGYCLVVVYSHWLQMRGVEPGTV